MKFNHVHQMHGRLRSTLEQRIIQYCCAFFSLLFFLFNISVFQSVYAFLICFLTQFVSYILNVRIVWTTCEYVWPLRFDFLSSFLFISFFFLVGLPMKDIKHFNVYFEHRFTPSKCSTWKELLKNSLRSEKKNRDYSWWK